MLTGEYLPWTDAPEEDAESVETAAAAAPGLDDQHGVDRSPPGRRQLAIPRVNRLGTDALEASSVGTSTLALQLIAVKGRNEGK